MTDEQIWRSSPEVQLAEAEARARREREKRAVRVKAINARYGPLIGAAMMSASKARGPWNKRSKEGGSFGQQAKDAFNAGNTLYNAAHGMKSEFERGVEQGWHPNVLTARAEKTIKAYHDAEQRFRDSRWTLQREGSGVRTWLGGRSRPGQGRPRSSRARWRRGCG